MRLAGHAPMPRDPPKYYAEFMADFSLREREQGEAARNGPLSTDPQRPWGNRRMSREEMAEIVEGKELGRQLLSDQPKIDSKAT